MPFKILALAPFKSLNSVAWSDSPVRIDKTDPNISSIGASVYIQLSEDICPAHGLGIKFSKFSDLHPDNIIRNTPFLKNLIDAGKFAEQAAREGMPAEKINLRLKEWPDIPPVQIKDKPEKKPASAVDNILQMVALPGENQESSADIKGAGQFDFILKQVLNSVFSHEQFRNIEGSWRGLKLMLQHVRSDQDILVEIVPADFDTLDETLDNLMPILANDLPSLVIIDLPFDSSPRSLELIEKIGRFSETLLVPAILWISSKFFNLSSWQDLKKLPFLPHYLEEPIFAKWRSLKKSNFSRWTAITCNRFLTRYPYGHDNTPRLVSFDEKDCLWTGPVWAAGSLIIRSIAETGWPTHFADIKLENLALHKLDLKKLLPVEADFSEERVFQFTNAGIMPLVAVPNKDFAFIPSDTTAAGSPLSYQSFVSRISQFVLWHRDNRDDLVEPEAIQKSLEHAVSRFWEKTGHPIPENFEVSAKHQPDSDNPDSHNQVSVRIVAEPSRQILRSGKKLELEFYW
ncbi:MAG: type VI secretion system contractile sheath large subunit [Desulfobacterales bacterium]|nr:type VI secretion system contractile sheath large subunit [Desulfobacterales bacterium]